MGLLSLFKNKRRTSQAPFSSYRSVRPLARKPFEPKGKAKADRERNPFLAKVVRGLKIFLFLLILIGLIYVVFLSGLFKIEKIDVKGSEATLSEQSALNKLLQEHLGKNLLFFNIGSLEDELLEQYPYLKEMDLSRDFFHTVKVTLETYPKRANIEVHFEDGSIQYYTVNELGYIAGFGQEENELPTVIMDVMSTDLDLPMEDVAPETVSDAPENESTAMEEEISTEKPSWALNEELIEQDILKTLLSTIEDFEGRFNMQVKTIYYRKQARELHLYTERDFYVWIDLTQDTSLQLTKLKKALSVLNIYEAPLDYIDLRISGQNGEKVIYKLIE